MQIQQQLLVWISFSLIDKQYTILLKDVYYLSILSIIIDVSTYFFSA